MPPVAEAPPAPAAPAGVRIVEAPAPKPLAAPTRELRPGDVAALPGESARTQMKRNLAERAKPAGEPTTLPTPVKEPTKQDETKTAAELDAEEAPPVEAPKPGDKPAENIDPKTGKPKKANPWKLFDEEKKARATAEQEIQRLKTSIVPEQERTSLMTRVEKAEARAKELEDHIRFVSYEKSTEFREQYQLPYENAWKRATTELSEIGITDPVTNEQRGVTSQDILELVNLPLGKARDIADEVFGKFADDVMAHRKEIRSLFDKQNTALEDAKKNGGLRDQQQREAFQKQGAEIQKFVADTWKAANEGFLSDKVNGEYFKSKTTEEGKELTPDEKEWNEALDRGYKLVDEAWGSNAMAKGLTPEQRQAIIKKNAAVRNRAAAFGPLKKLAKRLEARIAQLEKDLQQYTGSTPGAGGRQEQSNVQHAVSAREEMRQNLRKLAH